MKGWGRRGRGNRGWEGEGGMRGGEKRQESIGEEGMGGRR